MLDLFMCLINGLGAKANASNALSITCDSSTAGFVDPVISLLPAEDTEPVLDRFCSIKLSPAYAWLKELGLSCYAAAFVAAGYDEWQLLAALDPHDLEVMLLVQLKMYFNIHLSTSLCACSFHCLIH
jgi:hypothetical protein